MLRIFLKIVVFLSYFRNRPVLRKKKNPLKPYGSRGFCGGDCWTRTSDLLRVKQAL